MRFADVASQVIKTLAKTLSLFFLLRLQAAAVAAIFSLLRSVPKTLNPKDTEKLPKTSRFSLSSFPPPHIFIFQNLLEDGILRQPRRRRAAASLAVRRRRPSARFEGGGDQDGGEGRLVESPVPHSLRRNPKRSYE